MIKNFLFHRVGPNRDILWDPMDPKLFEKCIKYISKKYQVVVFEDIALTEEIFNTKAKYATIMFDDGYKDNIKYAEPILKKYNVKASFYVVTNCINYNYLTWTHILEYFFQNNNKIITIDLNYNFLAKDLRCAVLNSSSEKINYAVKLIPVLKKLCDKDRKTVLNKLFEFVDYKKLPKLMMNWNDLKFLKKNGHYVGSHTVTHNMLGTMTNKSDIFNELENSRIDIKNNLGHLPITISYPIGSFNEYTKKISMEIGYKIGLAVKQDTFHPYKDDIFEVPRIELYNEHWWKVLLRITGILEKIKHLASKK